jgi:prefoldin beta subunit
MKEISPQMQNQIAQYQQLQQQLQVLASQRMQLEAKAREIGGSLQELAKIGPEAVVYKSIGTLLVRADDHESVKKELEEHKETVSIRVRAIQKQETSLGERFEQLQQRISEALGVGSEGEGKES